MQISGSLASKFLVMLFCNLAIVSMAALAANTYAQPSQLQVMDFPSKPVRVVSPYPPGGVVDIAGRLLGAKLSEFWKQQVIVENRVGGSGVVGLQHVAKAAPDGYTILLATVGDFAVTPHAYSKLSFNVAKDFAPVIYLTDTPLVFAAHSSTPFNNIKEMIAHSRQLSGGLSYATPGLGTIQHVVAERFALETGAFLVHIPYKGGGPAGAALAAGEVPLGLMGISSAAPHVKTGRVKALGVATAIRLASIPEWPAINETVPGFIASNWVGAVVPTGTPRAIIDKLNADFNRALKLADVREKLNAVGTETGGSTVEEFANRLRTESEQFAKVIKQINLKLD